MTTEREVSSASLRMTISRGQREVSALAPVVIAQACANLTPTASSYPPKHLSSALISRLPPASARLLVGLLSLFSSICAHSKTNGMPPRKLASLFSPFLFGLADDQTFDATYTEWQRITDATEHIILAYVS